ncbi:sensor histidine kinase [Methylobacterium oryzisoli]|uniref:sensor histidine kinase n=1 Tax=Methylobacterium oryzisoli TaxID=3385502 RepID=UPI003891C169
MTRIEALLHSSPPPGDVASAAEASARLAEAEAVAAEARAVAALAQMRAEIACAEAARLRAAASDQGRALAEGEIRLASMEELNGRLRSSEAFTSRLLAASRDCIEVLSLDGTVLWLSEGSAAVLEAGSAGRVLGSDWRAAWPEPADRVAADLALAAARAGRTGRFRAASPTLGGTPRWWDVVLTPIPGDAGAVERVLAVARDVTDAHHAEEQQALLMQELAHRVKNILAMVQAVATQTLRGAASLEEAATAFGARLIALSHAHDILIQGSWAAADLRNVVEGAADLHGGRAPDRFRIEGPAVRLGPRSALALSLILHELATNAAKYGALSRAEGRVSVAWRIVAEADEPWLFLRWEEAGGPPVVAPTRSGFGSRLIERTLVHSLGGSASLTYPAAGVVFSLSAPLRAVQESSA